MKKGSSVFVCNLGKWVHVFKLDTSENEWVRLSSLENQMFVNVTASLAVVANDDPMVPNG